jgi:hydroxymethylglutaryl-CoA reductase (NADPH)
MLRLATQATLSRLSQPVEQPEQYRGQIENLIGVIRVPLGIAGPLAVNGHFASGVFYVPLATTEGTLVLAVTRGAEVMTAAGGPTVYASDQQVTRAPLFVFQSGAAARSAATWVVENYALLRSAAESTTRHGRLLWIEPTVLGRRLVLEFTYQTGDACGQNMVTFATDAVCQWLRERSPFDDVEFFTIESNISHDKKATNLTHVHRRGRRVNADITIPREKVLRGFRTAPEGMARVTREGTYGCVVSGVVGAQAQFANVLAALFVATGQDVATVAECGTGLTIVEVTEDGDLHASVTIPNLMVGTVGGGTRLAGQQECLELMGCAGAGCAGKLAEIAGAAILAGELALVASLASNTFAQAHAAFGRPPRPGAQR